MTRNTPLSPNQATWDIDALIAFNLETTIPDNGEAFYVYVLLRPDGRIFYVGKGKGDRIFKHEAEARAGVRSHKCNIIRQIWAAGDQVRYAIVFRTDDEQVALKMEKRCIAQYGRNGLANMTDGGDGTSGVIHSEESNAKLSASLRAHYADDTRYAETQRKSCKTREANRNKKDVPACEVRIVGLDLPAEYCLDLKPIHTSTPTVREAVAILSKHGYSIKDGKHKGSWVVAAPNEYSVQLWGGQLLIDTALNYM